MLWRESVIKKSDMRQSGASRCVIRHSKSETSESMTRPLRSGTARQWSIHAHTRREKRKRSEPQKKSRKTRIVCFFPLKI